MRIEATNGPSRRQARQHRERKHRTGRQQDADQVAGLCLGRECFGQSRDAVPQLGEGEGGVRIPDRDALRLPADDALEVLDDRPMQVFVAKARKEPIRGPVPVQRMLHLNE